MTCGLGGSSHPLGKTHHMSSELIINARFHETRVALLEDGNKNIWGHNDSSHLLSSILSMLVKFDFDANPINIDSIFPVLFYPLFQY